MTIEIRELVIEARVTDDLPAKRADIGGAPVRQRADDERLIEIIVRRVMSRVREQMER
ncbi:DUF5908 family protein [Collimonas humicola]|uniref:DUF5908 family protein n=1 Tax=Collimonas humicola TaxID=2825886 RepID=UPI001B8B9EF8|nr:DUF5908 family protein [Collimonas humicola]